MTYRGLNDAATICFGLGLAALFVALIGTLPDWVVCVPMILFVAGLTCAEMRDSRRPPE